MIHGSKLKVALFTLLCLSLLSFAQASDRVGCKPYEKLRTVPAKNQARILSALSERSADDETENTDDFIRLDGGDRRFGWTLAVAPVDFECRSDEVEYRERKGRFVSQTSVWVEIEPSEQQNVVGTSALTVAFVDREGRMIDFSLEKDLEELLCVGTTRPKLGANAILPKGSLKSPNEAPGSWFKTIDRLTGLRFVYPETVALRKTLTTFDAALTLKMSYHAQVYNLKKTAYPLRTVTDPKSELMRSFPLTCRVTAMPHSLDQKLRLNF